MRKHLLAIILLLSTLTAFSQLSIQMDSASVIVDFENTVSGVNMGNYVAEDPPKDEPADGQLDADAWSFIGVGPPPDSSRGIAVDGGVSPGGVYAFVVNLDTFLGVQPANNSFVPGSIVLTVVNQTGDTINNFDLSFERWVHNDEDRGGNMDVYVEAGDTMVFVPELSFMSDSTADQTPVFEATTVEANVAIPRIPPDSTLFIHWMFSDTTGSGARDEFGIDDIQITMAVLPIELTFFDAVLKGQSVELSWQTASEINNDFFKVQRSQDGIDFHSIGTVRGQGNSSQINEYHYMDHHPMPGTNYYRLLQVDFDGRSEVHPQRVVQYQSDISLFPTITADQLQVKGPVVGLEVHIVDHLGRRLSELILSDQRTIDVSAYPNGLYYVFIEGEGITQTIPFVKQ